MRAYESSSARKAINTNRMRRAAQNGLVKPPAGACWHWSMGDGPEGAGTNINCNTRISTMEE